MKYNRILSISIPIGILLSGCTTTPLSQPSGTNTSHQSSGTKKARPTRANHIQPLPYYVKFHHGLLKSRVSKVATATTCPNIYADLFKSPDDNQYYIRYIIRDKNGKPGEWHSKKSVNNESCRSKIFTTTFKYDIDNDIDVEASADGREVTIQGTGTDGKCYEWQSDSNKDSDSDDDDSDVRWKPVTPCK